MTVRDPGLQPERTSLAWVRTALATATAALIVERVSGGRPLSVVLAGTCLVLSGAALVLAPRRHRTSLAALQDGRSAADGTMPLLVSAAVTVLGVAGVALVLTGR